MTGGAEAADLLRMLLDRMKATPVNHGVNLSIELTEAEVTRLMEWADADDEAASDAEKIAKWKIIES